MGFIETPNALRSEPDVPSNEPCHGQEAGGPKSLPILHKRHAAVEAGHKRHRKDEKIDPQIRPVAHVRCCWLRSAFRASRR